MFDYTCTPKDLRVFNNLNNLDVLGRSIYYTSMLLRLKLPEVDYYPLFEFSSPKADFLQAREKYPTLEAYFYFLSELKKVTFKSSRLLDSICLVKNSSGDNFLEIRIIYPKASAQQISNLLNRFGIFPSIIN